MFDEEMGDLGSGVREELCEEELFALKSLSNENYGYFEVADSMRIRGYPLEVCVHCIRALHALRYGVADLSSDGRASGAIGLSPNELIKVRFAEYVGKLAAKEEFIWEWEVSDLTLGFVGKEHRRGSYCSVTITDRKLAAAGLQEAIEFLCIWGRWQEHKEFVDYIIHKAATELLHFLVPEECRPEVERWGITEFKEEKHPSLGTPFRYHQSTFLTSVLRRAEGITAMLEHKERDTMQWLFKDQLKEEQRLLRDWTSSSWAISLVKSSLANRIDQLIPLERYSDRVLLFKYATYHLEAKGGQQAMRVLVG